MVAGHGRRADGRSARAGDGAGSGIGRETALLCARRGADLAICDVDAAGLAATEAQARRFGRDVVARAVDVADRAQMQAFSALVHEHAGAVDLLVNNAAVGLGASFLETPLEDWDWIVPINVMGVVHGYNLFLPAMVERGRGHVVNLSSAAGYFANPSLVAYSATKFAVLGVSEAIRVELRPLGIGVTAVCPGLINTPITRNSRLRGDAVAQRERVIELYRRRDYGPDRVARRILHAVQHNRAVMPVTVESWVLWYLARFAPGLGRGFAGVMDRAARR